MGWGAFFKALRTRQHKLSPMTWVTLVAAVVYTVSPLDFIPELVFGPVGLVDDAGFWGIVLALTMREKARWEAQLADAADIIDVESY